MIRLFLASIGGAAAEECNIRLLLLDSDGILSIS